LLVAQKMMIGVVQGVSFLAMVSFNDRCTHLALRQSVHFAQKIVETSPILVCEHLGAAFSPMR